MANLRNTAGGSAEQIGKSGTAKPRTKEELQEALADRLYPKEVWPVRTVVQQSELLAQIATDVQSKKLHPRDAYKERLRVAWRIYLEES